MKSGSKNSSRKFALSVRWLLALFAGAVWFSVLFALLDMAEGGRAVGLATFAAIAVGSGLELARQAVILFGELWRLRSAPADALLHDVAEALRGLPLLGQADAAGVHGIYRRYTPLEEAEQEIRGALREQLMSGTGGLRVMGVAAPCLFQTVVGADLFGEHMPGSTVTVRAILLKEQCAWTVVRDGLEKGHLTREEIGRAFRYLDWMRAQWGAGRIQYRATDIPLPAFVVITDEWAFVEPYPIAEVRGPLGGKTPLLKLGVGTRGYEIWCETFELLWKYPEIDKLCEYAETLAP